jgi:hypothetical protein
MLTGAVGADMYKSRICWAAAGVEPEFADLVILDANPLADVANYRSVSSVVANGRLYDLAARRIILARLKAAGKSTR